MLCGYPITLKTPNLERQVACGQCMNCRINKKRMWTGRMLMEQRYCETPGTFLTITYNPEHHPEDGSLHKSHLREFTQKLRKKISYRFFAVGEYGDKSFRPHYHIALFGVPPDQHQADFEEAWTLHGKLRGYVMAGELNKDSCAYIANYTTKKMTKKDDERLEGRQPEFNTMSRYPPLGAQFMYNMLDIITSYEGSKLIATKGFPNAVTIDGKSYPMGHYWSSWLHREYVGAANEMFTEIDKTDLMETWSIDFDLYSLHHKHETGQISPQDFKLQLAELERLQDDDYRATKEAEKKFRAEQARKRAEKNFRRRNARAKI